MVHIDVRPSSGSRRYLVIASDGVWEFVTSQQASNVLSMHSVPAAGQGDEPSDVAKQSQTRVRDMDSYVVQCSLDCFR